MTSSFSQLSIPAHRTSSINPPEPAPVPSMSGPLEDDLRQRMCLLLQQLQRPVALEQYFGDVIRPPTADQVRVRRHAVCEQIRSLIANLPHQDSKDRAVYILLQVIDDHNLISLSLNALVEGGIGVVQLKAVFEGLISETLNLDRPRELFLSAVRYMTDNACKLDYKGARDILKLCLDKAHTFPVMCKPETMELIVELHKFVAMICDRKRNMLPAYFVINELLKLFPDQCSYPHWSFAHSLADVINSFRLLAQLLTIRGRQTLIPVAGHCSWYTGCAWRLEPHSMKVQMKGVLPYSPTSTAPQLQLLYYILQQPQSRDMLHGLFTFSSRSEKPKNALIEEVLVEWIMRVMDRAENDFEFYAQLAESTWNHIASQMIFLILLNYASFPRVVDSLHSRLQHLHYRRARDDLMWMLLQFLSGGIQKNSIDEFGGVLDLYRLLYSGEEQLTVSGSEAVCVRAMAPTCIWIHMNRKAMMPPNSGESSTSSSAVVSFALKVPPSIRTQMDFLGEELQRCGGFARDNYMLSVFCNAYSTNNDIFQTQVLSVILDALFLPSPASAAGVIDSSSSSNMPAQSVNNVFLPGGLQADGRIWALSHSFLDALTIHVKMNLVHNLFNHLDKFTKLYIRQSVSGSDLIVFPSPAAVETYSRLLLCTEIETHGIKYFTNTLLHNAFRSGNIDMFNVFTEMLAYRLIPAGLTYRLQAILTLHTAIGLGNSSSFSNNSQLILTVEACIVRHFLWLSSQEATHSSFYRVLAQILDVQNRPGFMYDHEEIVKIAVYTVTKGLVVCGAADELEVITKELRELIARLAKLTPWGGWWSPGIGPDCLPSTLHDIYPAVPQPPSGAQQHLLLKQQVDEAYMHMRTQNSEAAQIEYYMPRAAAQGAAPASPSTVLLCLLWRLLSVEKQSVPPVAYKILDRLGARLILHHLRALADWTVYEISQFTNTPQYTNAYDALAEMIWRYQLFSIDRFLLVLLNRPFDRHQSQTALGVVENLLHRCAKGVLDVRLMQFLMGGDGSARGVSSSSCDPPFSDNFFTRHADFHQKYPEKSYSQILLEMGAANASVQPIAPVLPSYYSNVCLRLLPVLDLVFARFIEMLPVAPKYVEPALAGLISKYGGLYRYHPQLEHFVYSTLFYYERQLRQCVAIKVQLVSLLCVGGTALSDVGGARMSGEWIAHFCSGQSIDVSVSKWQPDAEYYARVVGRVMSALQIPFSFAAVRNARSHPLSMLLQCSCAELMALPQSNASVGEALVGLVIDGVAGTHPLESPTLHHRTAAGGSGGVSFSSDSYQSELGWWVNAVALIVTSLPPVFSAAFFEQVQQHVRQLDDDSWWPSANSEPLLSTYSDRPRDRLLSLFHAILQHVSVGQLLHIVPHAVHKQLWPLCNSEARLFYVLALLCPSLQRLHFEKYNKQVLQLAVNLYELVLQVDKSCLPRERELRTEFVLADLFYHLKYQYVGDSIKADTDRIVAQMRPSLRDKLRFISQHHAPHEAST